MTGLPLRCGVLTSIASRSTGLTSALAFALDPHDEDLKPALTFVTACSCDPHSTSRYAPTVDPVTMPNIRESFNVADEIVKLGFCF